MSKDSTCDCACEKQRDDCSKRILKGPERPYMTGHNSFGEFLLEKLRANPEFIGEVDGVTGREINFSEMMEKSVKCAMWLSEEGLRTGDVVGICTHNHVDMYVPCFASLYLGAVFNPWWNAAITKDLARYFLNSSKPRFLFVDEASAVVIVEVIGELNLEIKVIVLEDSSGFRTLDDVIGSQVARPASEFRCARLSSLDEPAVILYTSGTTGYPKGCLHSNRSLFRNTSVFSEMGRIEGDVRSLMFSPLAWCSGMMVMLGAVVRQREIRIIYPEFQEEKTLELIEKFKVNWMFLATSAGKRLHRYLTLPSQKRDLASLKYIWITGDCLSKRTLENVAGSLPETRVLQCYGLSEIGVVTQQSERSKRDSCGYLIANMQMKVVDTRSGRLLGPNEPGEALVKSPNTIISYLDNPSATKNAIDAEGWLHTGDIVYYDESDQIYVTDRIKELIKYDGNHVSPSMIEDTLLRHPDVAEVVVVGKPHKIDGAHPVAFVVKKSNSEVTRAELEELVACALPDYMKLRGGVTFIDKTCHTASGKIDRVAMKKLLGQSSSTSA